MQDIQPNLETPRLSLRPFVAADARTVERLAGDRAISQHMLQVPHPYPPGAALAWIGTHAADFAGDTGAHFAITLSATRELCGAISLDIQRAHRRAGMGYWLGQAYWRQGYAAEAARAVIAYGFSALKLNRIAADHFVANPASGRVMQKAGMRHEGTLRQYYLKDGAYIDVELYAVVATDWPAGG